VDFYDFIGTNLFFSAIDTLLSHAFGGVASTGNGSGFQVTSGGDYSSNLAIPNRQINAPKKNNDNNNQITFVDNNIDLSNKNTVLTDGKGGLRISTKGLKHDVLRIIRKSTEVHEGVHKTSILTECSNCEILENQPDGRGVTFLNIKDVYKSEIDASQAQINYLRKNRNRVRDSERNKVDAHIVVIKNYRNHYQKIYDKVQ